MLEVLIEIYGWLGAICIVAAYYLNSFEKIERGYVYQALNLFGAIGVVVVSFYRGAYSPGVLNCVWAGIAFIAIINLVASKGVK